MKRIISSLALLFGTCLASFAQTDSFTKFYGSCNISFAGPKLNTKLEAFAFRSLGIELGYRLTDRFSVFIPVSADMQLLNVRTTKNFNETGTVGLGATYAIPLSSFSFLEPVLACSTTFLKTDFNYFTHKYELRWSTNVSHFRPFVGLGVQHVRFYDYEPTSDMKQIYLSLGIRL